MCDSEEEMFAIRNEVGSVIENYNFEKSHKHYHNNKFIKAMKTLKQK